MRSKEQIAVLHDLFNQINERLGIIGETPDAYFLCQCVEILKQQGATIDAQSARITELEARNLELHNLCGSEFGIAFSSDHKTVFVDGMGLLDVGDSAKFKLMEAQLEDAKKSNQWIPVSERLPENNTRVFVVNKFGQRDMADVYEGAFENCWDIDDADETITHWMPLPAAPAIQAEGKA